MESITKTFPGVQALNSVDFDCKQGEIHSLAGENGAGKSTLMKILVGIYSPNEGEILLRGKKVNIRNILDAEKLGISIVFQELSLIPHLSAMENMFIGEHPKNKLGMVDWDEMEEKSTKVLGELGFSIDPNRIVVDLSVAEQKIIEICRALTQNPDIIILDEPTAALSRQEVEKFFGIINKLKKQGHTIIFISHRIKEIMQIADRVTILKDGNKVNTYPIQELNEDKIVLMMVGRELKDIFPPHVKEKQKEKEIFTVKNLSVEKKVFDVSFSVYGGKILGIGGLEGQGQRTLLRALFGLESKETGDIYIHEKRVAVNSPQQAKRANIILIPDDRQTEGLFMLRPVRENISIATLEQRQHLGIIAKKEEEKTLQGIVSQLAIKITSLKQNLPSLSGGNLQKVVLAKWLIAHPKVILLLEPTKGVDVATKSQIYYLLRDLAQQNVAIIMYATDMLELIGLCDQVIIMYEGKVTKKLEGKEITEEAIMQAAVGKTTIES